MCPNILVQRSSQVENLAPGFQLLYVPLYYGNNHYVLSVLYISHKRNINKIKSLCYHKRNDLNNFKVFLTTIMSSSYCNGIFQKVIYIHKIEIYMKCNYICVYVCMGFPDGSVAKNHPQGRRHGFNPWVRKIPWRREWLSTLEENPTDRGRCGLWSMGWHRIGHN